MKRPALFFSTFTTVMLTLPAVAADRASDILEVRWGKNAFNFEGMPSGPQPLRNLSRLPNGSADSFNRIIDGATCVMNGFAIQFLHGLCMTVLVAAISGVWNAECDGSWVG